MYSHIRDYPADLLERASRVRLACFDVDGTLTDGRLVFDGEGREYKAFHVRDGLGLALLRKAGIEIAFVTARSSPIVERRAHELGVRACTKVGDKLACVAGMASALEIDLQQVAFMGDDLVDLSALQAVGLSVAPADAHAWVRERVHWRTVACGGVGAARELCDLILASQGKAEAALNDALRSQTPSAQLANADAGQ